MKRYQTMSRLYAPTLKEDPTEAELVSHKLLLRAGMIRKTAAGLYSYLPLCWRVIRKIEDVIRDEMEGIGAQEMLTPIVTPGELWEQSGRYAAYGPELMRLKDRHDRDFVLGPTHEETYTDLVRNELRSYKQLPVTLYHIQDKFRDELRPRFGLMRGREFIMKDAYSFSATQESLQQCYDDEKAAYARIAERCGLKALPVVADSGQIGGDTSVEFMALADAGEAELVWCDCGFAADTEAATTKVPVQDGPGHGELRRIETPGTHTIEELAELLEIDRNATVKSLCVIDAEGKPVLALVPGDHELNDCKAEHVFGAGYRMMTDDELKGYKLPRGSIGPVRLTAGIRIVCDESLKDAHSWACGANVDGYHYVGVEPGRDFAVDEWADLITVAEGDPCPKCGCGLHSARGIEISQVFQLGTKYSEAMGATFMDEDGREKPFLMGCYGIGVSRMVSAVVEQHNDERGICWPVCVAPYEVEVVAMNVNDDVVWPVAQKVTEELAAADLEVLLDDRKERPGVKFADADLIGVPYQVILGKKGVANETAEVKVRATGERFDVPFGELASWLGERVVPARA
ncbi:proline--tRNA ligase [Paratractidigestivibacter sp.]|uniref:proline--tRNA ligase n=2 Tax=Paratractidigestivibacter sp. TaxID=2847316 RepID=UPI003A103520